MTQAKKKDFTQMENPADILQDEISTEPDRPEVMTTGKRNVVRHKAPEQKRSERMGLLVTPATARDIKLIASLKETSVNAIANKLLENYIKSYSKKNPDTLESARKLFK